MGVHRIGRLVRGGCDRAGEPQPKRDGCGWRGSRDRMRRSSGDHSAIGRVLGWARAERGHDDARMCGGEDRNGRGISARTDGGGKVGSPSAAAPAVDQPALRSDGRARASGGGTARCATLVATRAAAISR
jgi:hypothetical protein